MMKIKHKALIHFLNNTTVRAAFDWLYLQGFFKTRTLLKYNKYSGRNL